MKRTVRLLTSFFGVGYFPFAPATLATAITAVLLYLTGTPTASRYFLILPCLFLSGVYLSTAAEREWGKDSGKIVIDEILGFLVAIAFLPFEPFGGTGHGLALAFFLFRFYDIVKPFPAGWSQSFTGGWGVMTDDLFAGLYTNVTLRIFVWLFSGKDPGGFPFTLN